MEKSIFIARIFGLCYLVIGTGLILNRKAFKQVISDFYKNAALVFFAGVFSLVIGVVIILIHNVWVANRAVVITIIGWAGFIKGIWMIVFPDSVSKFMHVYQKDEKLLMLHSIAVLIFGAVLTFLGFSAG